MDLKPVKRSREIVFVEDSIIKLDRIFNKQTQGAEHVYVFDWQALQLCGDLQAHFASLGLQEKITFELNVS